LWNHGGEYAGGGGSFGDGCTADAKIENVRSPNPMFPSPCTLCLCVSFLWDRPMEINDLTKAIIGAAIEL